MSQFASQGQNAVQLLFNHFPEGKDAVGWFSLESVC